MRSISRIGSVAASGACASSSRNRLLLPIERRTFGTSVGTSGSRPLLAEQPSFGSHDWPAPRVQEAFLLNANVAGCEVQGGVAYVRMAPQPLWGTLLALFRNTNSEQALREHLQQCGYEGELPEIQIVDQLPELTLGTKSRAPFMLPQILDALFIEIDTNRNGSISLEEFTDFCNKVGLFSKSQEEIRQIFDAADGHTARNRSLDTVEFKKLILDSGIVEVRGESLRTAAADAYFLEERVVDTVLKWWLARYDTNKNGAIDQNEYARLLVDYSLPFSCSPASFARYDKNGDGLIDVQELRFILEEAHVLATGKAIARKDDAEGMRTAWRALEESQAFLPVVDAWKYGAGAELPQPKPGTVRFVCISDTHGQHEALTGKLPQGDVLLHAGDFSMCGDLQEVKAFGSWLAAQPFDLKVVIPGNHDLTFDGSYEAHEDPRIAEKSRATLAATGGPQVVHLEDDEVMYRGLRVYGSAWQPAFGSWAFNLPRGHQLAERWRAVPEGIDILLVHGPPLGRGDRCYPGEGRVGCADLLAEIQGRIKPAFCVSGHVHEDPSASFDGVTRYINATSSNEDYSCENGPWVFDLPARA